MIVAYLSTRVPASIVYRILQYAPFCDQDKAKAVRLEKRIGPALSLPYYICIGIYRYRLAYPVHVHHGHHDHQWFRVGYRVTYDGAGFYVGPENDLYLSGDGKTYRLNDIYHWRRYQYL